MKIRRNHRFFIAFVVGVVVSSLSCVCGGVISDKDLDTLLLRSGASSVPDNEQVASVSKDVYERIALAPTIPLNAIPKRLQPIIQYALDRPYPGSADDDASNYKLKKTIVYLITSKMRQRGSRNQNQVVLQPLSLNYGAPEASTKNIADDYRRVQKTQKTITKSLLEPQRIYSATTVESDSEQQQQGYASPSGRVVSNQQQQQSYSAPEPQMVITLRARPTPQTPDFEIIKTISSDEGLLGLQKQFSSDPPPQAIYQSPAAAISENTDVQFVAPAPSVQEEIDEGLSVLGGPQGLSELVAKIEGLGDTPQPHQLEPEIIENHHQADISSQPDTYSVPVPVPIGGDGPPTQYHGFDEPQYNPPVRETQAEGGVLKTAPFQRINSFFKNVLRSFRNNLTNLKAYRPKIIYDNEPWPSFSSSSQESSGAHAQQPPNGPIHVSTTTYTQH